MSKEQSDIDDPTYDDAIAEFNERLQQLGPDSTITEDDLPCPSFSAMFQAVIALGRCREIDEIATGFKQ